eukprot:Phypoly_transcript_06312.p1 GENE.Phypoly_transcript_06312~~Phypoly_transcript_06312.p1  ORF type:complete len:477 (+),score=80.93 Phypoly_transcript_06312:50-1480(+)
MSFEFFSKGTDIIKNGIQKDEAHNYPEALKLYIHGIEHWIAGVKYCKNESTKILFRQKILEFLLRAETIKEAVKQKETHVQAKKTHATAAKAAQVVGEDANSEVDSETKRLRESIAGAILREKPDVTYKDVAGLENAKRALDEAVLMPLKLPQMFKHNRKPWKGILMYGPPGTGKTYLAKATANAANATFFSVSSSDLVSKYVGESEKLVRELFTMAISNKPAIIFIDEIDSIASKRTDDENDASRRLKNEFLIQMSRVADAEGVLVLAATNRPFELDPAVRRRFEKRIYIPLPDAAARLSLLKMQVEGEENPSLNAQHLVKLAEQTERYSGSDIAVLAREALMAPVREAVKAVHWKRVPRNASYAVTPCTQQDSGSFTASLMELPPDAIQLPDLTYGHFEKALQHTRPTVSKADIAEHERFTKLYGENGQDLEIEDEPLEKKEPAVGSKVAVQEKKRTVVKREKTGTKGNPVLVG